MATVGTNNPTLQDVASRLDPNGSVDTIVELLSETNEILIDATFIEANDGSNNKTTVRTGLPNATWRKLYQGVQPSKSTTTQVSDSSGMLEAYAESDIDLVDKAPDPAGFRLSEERPFIEVMNQNVADTLFYGDTAANPERFTGLSARYDALSTDKTKSGYNIISGGGAASDNTSIWLIVWGPTTAYMFYPKGSKAGLKQEDLGIETTKDASGGLYRVYRSHYKWDVGFTVRDWRSIVRVANIDVTDLVDDAATGANINELLIDAVHRVKGKKMGRAALYCNEGILTYMDKQTWNKSNLHLTYKDVQGEQVVMFRGIPIRECEALLDTEATVA